MRSVSSARAVSRITGTLLVARMIAGQRQPVLARHHDVEQDEVDRISRQHLPRRRRVFRLGDAHAVARQIGGERLADVALVVDQQDMRFLGHGATS